MSARRCLAHAAARLSVAAGYRLLAAHRRPAVLRWASDPDGPDLRDLVSGEVRLGIVSLQLDAGVWPGPREGGDAARHAGAWVPLLALGAARVVESRMAEVEPDWMVCGLLPISTHWVLRPGSSGDGVSPQRIELRAARTAAAHAGSDECVVPALHRLGIDAVERRVRQRLAQPSGQVLPISAHCASWAVSTFLGECPITEGR